MRLGAAAIRALAGAGCSPVIVVVRPDDDLKWLESMPAGHRVRPCVCADADAGISRSIRRGVQAAMEDGHEGEAPDAVMIALADMPFLSAGRLAEWRTVFARSPDLDFVAGRFRGAVMPPVLWARRRFGELLRLEGDAGAGALIRSGALRGAFVEMTELESRDLDTPEQLEEARVIWHAHAGARCTNIPGCFHSRGQFDVM